MKPTRSITFTPGAALLALAVGFYVSLGPGQSSASPASSADHSLIRAKVREGFSDTAITAKVKAGLLNQKDLGSMRIHVRTRDGVVRLTGSVPTMVQRQMATKVAKGVTGVASVENDLIVH
ncbi:Osmotically-inducible protein Y [Ralstonia mannitolilytica]|uniref:BON domain-containing protein n=1 Tax=Ralstonia TaxID=48736 RepID=UPI0004695205|nr:MULTISPECIES: BON domain-containing protein [Ralstonia]CAJ0805035.1 Osmotically-inducible protein Y [Ralstonia mannitolilytica]CAJ0901649.1 Osmotically-inducible protein Y [Ralstonia sp. LMG 18095]